MGGGKNVRKIFTQNFLRKHFLRVKFNLHFIFNLLLRGGGQNMLKFKFAGLSSISISLSY